MSRVFHIVAEDEWRRPGYRPASLDAEGFVHCSFEDQVPSTLERHFAGVQGLVLVELDPRLLGEALVVEDTSGHGAFPHLYGPIPSDAVLGVRPAR